MRFKTLKYIGALGEVDMTSPPILYQTHDFTDVSYDYDTNNLPGGFGSKLNRFTQFGKTNKIDLSVWGETLHEEIDRLTEIFEYDIKNKKPGRIYLNDYYLDCYITATQKKDWEKAGDAITLTLTVYSEVPSWVKEIDYLFIQDFEEVDITEGFKFPAVFPNKFSSLDAKRVSVKNETVSSMNAIITFYGPAEAPAITIAGVTYGFTESILAGERYVIDQRKRTVMKHTRDGRELSAINQRIKDNLIFTKIPVGRHVVGYNEEFDFKVTLLLERGEPEWT